MLADASLLAPASSSVLLPGDVARKSAKQSHLIFFREVQEQAQVGMLVADGESSKFVTSIYQTVHGVYTPLNRSTSGTKSL